MAAGIGAEYITHPYPDIRAGKTGDVQALVAAGAISVTSEPTRLDVTSGADVAFTMADGTEGQNKLIYAPTKGVGNAVVTPTNLVGAATTITFGTAKMWAELKFMGGTWHVVAGDATVA